MSAAAATTGTIDSPVLRLNLLIISWTGVAAFALLLRHGMTFDLTSAATAVSTIILLWPFAVIFERRGIAPFANMLTGFLCMVAFNVFLSILTYAGTPLNAPLADGWLMNVDSALGIHLPSIVAWTATWPIVKTTFDAAYPSVMLSTLLALVVLGLDPDRRRMQEFVLQFMFAGLLTTIVFFLLPAAGPFAAYGYELRPDQQRFLDHFDALRSGRFHRVSLNHLEGLITFPSFHTAWALLLAWGFRRHRWLRIPMLILNLMVVVSTLTTGWHYGTDVIGGGLVALTAAAATHRLRPCLQFVPAMPDASRTNTSTRQTALQSRPSANGEGNL
ncbi:MAG: phosphatase PAP2 family protein [Planctomycetaceae bacterium]|jgi:membrane-associated phospholipid phosphatase